ncbi:hypothetical protein M8J77_007687 [Diaphorina citri]|nr:hypothetical protein M8J77_007687 [Diaphorina citri]
MNAHHLLHLFLYLTVVSIGFCKVTNITDFVPEVNIDKLGKVRGRVTMSHWTKRLIYSFQGIPYAIPPVGKMRFQSPRPAQPWTTPLNATSLKRRCPQIFDASSNIEVLTSTEALEDCLYLNVYTPMISSNVNQTEASQKLFPVIFYIHGGSFRVGSSHSMTPHYLLEKDVVLVTIQYRLGILGFLSLETNEIPGNMGFLDMLLALEWVNDHIRSFNGDKNCVTLMGQSAGGAAVTFFLTSPLVRDDLFHRAIIQSGSGLCDWSFENETGMGRQFIEDLGCRLDNVDDSFVAECLRRKSLSDLFKTYYSMEYGGKFCQAVKQTHGKKRFLTETPEESFAKGAVKNVPVLLGVTKHEGSSFLEVVFRVLWDDPIVENFTDFKVQDLAHQFMEYTRLDVSAIVSHLVETQYFSQNYATMKDVIPAMSDTSPMALVLQKRTFNRSRNELVNSEKAIEAVKNDPLGDHNYEAVRIKFQYFSDRLKVYEKRRDELKTAVQGDEDLSVLIPEEGEDLYKKLFLWLTHIEESLKQYQVLRGRKEEDYDYELLLDDVVVDEYISPLDDPFPDEFIDDCDEFTEDCDMAEEEVLVLHDEVFPEYKMSPSSVMTGTECSVSMEATEGDGVPKCRASDGSDTLLAMTTPELESGKNPSEMTYEASTLVSAPDALEQPVVYGPLFDTPEFFGYLYFIFLKFCSLLSMFKNFRFPKKLAGLAVLKSCVFHTARLLSSMHNSTFLYSFHFKGRFTKYFEYRDKNDSRFPHGVAHSDDLIYLFWDPTMPLNDREQKQARTMVDLWTNFATYGYPFSEDVPDWQPVANDSLGPFLRIDERSELRKSFLEEFTIATREGVEAYYSENGGSCERTSWVHVILCTLLHLLLVKYKT